MKSAVVCARKWLVQHPESCKLYPGQTPEKFRVQREHETPSRNGRPPIDDCERGKHGSQECIAAFLGENNWSRKKVDRLLDKADLDDDAKALANTDFVRPSNHLEDDDDGLGPLDD